MLEHSKRELVASILLRAERDRELAVPLGDSCPGMDIDDAYAIQRILVEERIKAGARVIGHKIGLTSRSAQIALHTTEPAYGVLLDDMHYRDGARIPMGKFIQPRLEVELAFVLSKPLAGPSITLFDVLDATAFVTPALEIIDARTPLPRPIFDTIADNGTSAAIVTGGRVVRPMDIDLRWVGATLSRNGVIEGSGVSAAVLGHPATSVAWLANKLAGSDMALQAGHVVLAGAFVSPIKVQAGDTLHADFGPMGSIGVAFE